MIVLFLACQVSDLFFIYKPCLEIVISFTTGMFVKWKFREILIIIRRMLWCFPAICLIEFLLLLQISLLA